MGSTSEGSSNLLGSIGRGGSMGYGGSQGRGGSVGNSGSEAGGLSIVSRNLRHTEQRIGTFQNKLYLELSPLQKMSRPLTRLACIKTLPMDQFFQTLQRILTIEVTLVSGKRRNRGRVLC